MKAKFTDVKFLQNDTLLMKIYDYDYHKEGEKGRDIICKCLEYERNWKPFQTELMSEIFRNTTGSFVDIGCHVGYFSVLACLYGKRVYSYDQDYDYLSHLKSTKEINKLDNLNITCKFVDKNYKIPKEIMSEKISVLKIDTNCQEAEIIKVFLPLKIPYIIAKISPKINNSYLDMCRKMRSEGYDIYNIGLSNQRELNFNTHHLDTIKRLEIKYDNIEEYLKNIQHGQTNFLFVKT